MNDRQRNAKCNQIGDLIIWSVAGGMLLSLIIAGWF